VTCGEELVKTSPWIAGDAQGARRVAETVARGLVPLSANRTVTADTRPGWVWALPRGPGCAAHARSVLAEALAAFDLPRDVVGDAQLMVSELATNAYQHAEEHGPHELWLYPREYPREPGAGTAGPPAGGRRSPLTSVDDAGEVRCAVFDRFADACLPGYSWTSGDCGRGLSIVRELSEGRWGTLRGLSRLGPHAPGKAVWFALPG
jgi:Histidine kinase-like ATPase domain